jgi:hypothetical protein
MKDNLDIDELLNGFIDGELTQRQLSEVNRLVAHDTDIAKRLQELKKCKLLLGSVPCAEAPADMLEDIKLSLERRTLLGHSADREKLEGARHLLYRKMLSAAAMLTLVAALVGVVVYILVGTGNAGKQFADEDLFKPAAKVKQAKPAGAEKTAPQAVADAAVGFTGRLELKTNAPVAVNAVIVRAIAENSFLEYGNQDAQIADGVYVLNCSRRELSSLLADLENIWTKFDSTALFIETGRTENQVTVKPVTTQQIIEIASQNNLSGQLALAKDFAALNDISGHLPGKEVLAAVDNKKPDLITIPKPVLTSGEKTAKKSTANANEAKDVHLTIVVVSGG